MTLTQGQRSNLKVKQEVNETWVHISKPVWPRDFKLGTKIQPNKAHSMIQVPMTLTKGQGHRSRSNVQKLAKIYKTGHISEASSPTDFILDAKVQPNKAHSMTQVPMTLT